MNKVKPFFQVEIGASQKRADVKNCHLPNQFLGKVIKFQINTISLSKVMTFLYVGQ